MKQQELWSPPPPGQHHQQHQHSLMDARARLINTTLWWGGGSFPMEEEKEKEGETGERGEQWQAMAWAVLMRRASLHACARHEAAVAGRVRSVCVSWGDGQTECAGRRVLYCCWQVWQVVMGVVVGSDPDSRTVHTHMHMYATLYG